MGRKRVELPTSDPQTADVDEAISDDDQIASDARTVGVQKRSELVQTSTRPRIWPSALQSGARHPTGAI